MKPGTKVGELKVWNVINPPNEPDLYPVESPKEAKELIDKLANMQLKAANVYSNAFGLVEWDGEEWTEWYDEDGFDIDETDLGVMEDEK